MSTVFDETSPYAEATERVEYCARCRRAFVGEHECDLGPVRFERRDVQDFVFTREATYRAYCPTCNKAFDIKTDQRNVQRPTEQEMHDAADPTVGVRGDAAGWLSLADRMFGNHEKRRELEEQNRKVDAFEAMLRYKAMRALGELCPHVRKR